MQSTRGVDCGSSCPLGGLAAERGPGSRSLRRRARSSRQGKRAGHSVRPSTESSGRGGRNSRRDRRQGRNRCHRSPPLRHCRAAPSEGDDLALHCLRVVALADLNAELVFRRALPLPIHSTSGACREYLRPALTLTLLARTRPANNIKQTTPARKLYAAPRSPTQLGFSPGRAWGASEPGAWTRLLGSSGVPKETAPAL
jgi:hypothetical protein